MESSCFAFLAGINNFASMISELSGGLIFEAAGIKTTLSPASGACNFDALWWLIILCHVSLPIAIGVPAAWLIPNVLQTESLQAADTDNATAERMVTNLVSDTDDDDKTLTNPSE
jgi:hypothetical protein